MESDNGNSLYELLKEELRRKNTADAHTVARNAEILQDVKSFVKYLIKPSHISNAIETIAKIRNDLEKGGCPEQFGMTQSDFDLILLINAIVLCCGCKWEEAEELFYLLTEKYQESVFYALLGIVKNKLQIFRSSRDTFCLAQKTSHKPQLFRDLKIVITSLNETDLKEAIDKFLIYTKNREDIPLYKYINANNITEFNDNKTLGSIFRENIFPILKDQIDIFLRGIIPNLNDNQEAINDQATQTNVLNMSKGLQTELIKTVTKSAQTLKLKEKNLSERKDTEISTLKSSIEELKKTNFNLTKLLNEATTIINGAQNKINRLEGLIREIRQNYSADEATIIENLRRALAANYSLEKYICARIGKNSMTIDTIVEALGVKLRILGLNHEIDTIRGEAMRQQMESLNINKAIDVRYNQVLSFINARQFLELLNVNFGDYVNVLHEQPDSMIDLISKLVTICQDNGLIPENAENSSNIQQLDEAAGVHTPGTSLSHFNTVGVFQPPIMYCNQSCVGYQPSVQDFPPLGGMARYQLRKINDQSEFQGAIMHFKRILPQCSIGQLTEAVKAIQTQKKIHFKHVKVQDVTEYFRTTQTKTEDEVRPLYVAYERVSDPKPENEEKSCPICLEDNVTARNQHTLPCGHLFHKDCVKEWLKNRVRCPVCRVPATSGTS